MIEDLAYIDGISVFLSKDAVQFEKVIELNKSILSTALVNQSSILKIISSLTQDMNKIISEGVFSSYSIQLHFQGNTLFLSDSFVSSRFVSTGQGGAISSIDFNENKFLYDSLTQREKQILCFLSRGYKPAIICFVLFIGIETFKSHRKNLYSKMNFLNKSDLQRWADRYLDLYFNYND
ncbi:MAG TPA: helix-turn-helix transcriptional regulator [Bacteroidia bacterium]|nr:helix-turn-helix transcriptional regulator [Bacteroidia bacterium]HNQ00482.1 helix-turn-helix transcriptional regulator [Bacteroidia bacterium]